MSATITHTSDSIFPAGSPTDSPAPRGARSPLGTFAECPQCAGPLRPEHAHFRCDECGWRDSCCD